MTSRSPPWSGHRERPDPPEDESGALAGGLHERALAALRARRFDLAEELLSREDPEQAALIENLRIYQAELEIQNEELVQSQHRIQDALDRFTSFFNTLPIAELVIDRQGLIHEANPAAQRLFHLRGAHFHQHFFARLIAESDRSTVIDVWDGLTENTSTVVSEVRFRSRSEEDFIGDLHIAPIPSLDEGARRYVCAIIDRTEAVRQRRRLRETSERLDYLAHHDALTGLPNRACFQERLEQCLQRAKRYRRQFALLFLDLDRFKEVNDTLGLKVLELGCRQMVDWDAAGLHVPRLAVNLSVRELERSRLPGQIAAILERTGLDPARLELEVTESKLMRHAEMAIRALNAMRALGVTLAIDDFGTGYSSLSYLKRLPLNRLKIDRSFVEGLTRDVNDDSITRAIIALARTLGLEVLAEGIEAHEQAEFLFREGCVEGQGYLYDRPLSPEELAANWLQPSE